MPSLRDGRDRWPGWEGAALRPGSRAGAGGGGHEGAEDGVHAGLVAGALGADLRDDVGIEAQGEALLG
jgi:hypothetical protein